MTMTGDMMGTLRYMSPEQALAKRVVVDHRTDVYSLGATLYELLTLEPAFSGRDRQELLRQIAFEEPRPLRRINRAIPVDLETVAQKAMEKNPAERYASAKELADDLKRFLADEPIRARPVGKVRRLRKWGRRHPAVVAAAAASLLATVMVLAGTIGWMINDRAKRVHSTADEIDAALKESAEWQERRRLPEALSAARRAKGALAGGHGDTSLVRKVEARENDLQLLVRLEAIRLDYSWVISSGPDNDNTGGVSSQFDYHLVDTLYRNTFREAGFNMEDLPAQEFAAQLLGTTVSVELAADLDAWSFLSPVDLTSPNPDGSIFYRWRG
jgi:hypothetical protein